MNMEHLKSVILTLLILLSVILSYTLWTGVQQYEALPVWFTEVPNKPNIDPIEPDAETITVDALLSAIVAPERLVEHDLPRHYLYWLTSDSYSRMLWNSINVFLNKDVAVQLRAVEEADWLRMVNKDSYEFIFAGNYPIEILFPSWQEDLQAINVKIDRIIVAGNGQPEIMVRAMSRKYYSIQLSDIEWPENGVSTLVAKTSNSGWSVYDAGRDNPNIATGVYLPLNFINNYSSIFPEIWVSAELPDKEKWLPLFFANTNLAREIILSNNKYNYTLGPALLDLDYNKAPHLEYLYTLLEAPELQEVSYIEALSGCNTFIAERNPTNWLRFETNVRLTQADYNNRNNEFEFIYDRYVTDLSVNVPIESIFPAWDVNSENGVVTKMERQIWKIGRFNYLPKIQMDAPEAIIRLSSDDWKIATDLNPYAPEAIEDFQSYLAQGYTISDVYISYFTQQDLTREGYLPPHWAVTLTNEKGSEVRFYINAMTGHIPLQKGVIQ